MVGHAYLSIESSLKLGNNIVRFDSKTMVYESEDSGRHAGHKLHRRSNNGNKNPGKAYRIR